MARRYDSKDAKRRILAACVRLFLEKGYTHTRVAEILKAADVSAGSFQNIFRTKDGVLTELVGIMFDRQFGAVRTAAAALPSPVYVYAMETALQLALTEMNENLRDIYVEAYTYPATAEMIHQRTAKELQKAFGSYLPDCAESDFYEIELGTAGIMRGYMVRKCRPLFHAGKEDQPLPGNEPERLSGAARGTGADSGLRGRGGCARSRPKGHGLAVCFPVRDL